MKKADAMIREIVDVTGLDAGLFEPLREFFEATLTDGRIPQMWEILVEATERGLDDVWQAYSPCGYGYFEGPNGLWRPHNSRGSE